MSSRLQRVTAAYLGLAIGDALGATVEFMTPNEIRNQFGVHKEICGGGWLHLPAGEVTDDTTMSLALGEAIITAEGRVESDQIASAFDSWMRGKPVDIGNTVRRGILQWRNLGRSEVSLNEYDGGNGACMRTLPVAIATLGADASQVARATLAQAHTTHNHPESDAATLLVVEMLQRAFEGAGLRQLEAELLLPFIQQWPVFDYRGRREENPSGYIVHTLRAVLQGLLVDEGFEKCLINVVNRGGDADTTGAIAGMLAGALYGFDALPTQWLKRLSVRRRQECQQQAQTLLSLAPVSIRDE